MSAIALIERSGELLLERRTDAPLWSLIAGRVDYDEPLGDALIREVREETNLEVTAFELFGTFSNPTRIVAYPDGNVYRVVSFAYLVTVASFEGIRASDESEELRFFPRDVLLDLGVPATQRHILELYVQGGPYPHLH
ncbi:MAG: NUDIX domain-containing protein [Gaiellales bacterium]